MIAVANVPMVECYKLFQEAANTATKIDWLTIITIKNVQQTRIKHYGQDIPSWSGFLRTWGEAGTVKWGKDGKLGDRGITMMFVGYANNHARDVYRMLNPSTWQITQTRDIASALRAPASATRLSNNLHHCNSSSLLTHKIDTEFSIYVIAKTLRNHIDYRPHGTHFISSLTLIHNKF